VRVDGRATPPATFQRGIVALFSDIYLNYIRPHDSGRRGRLNIGAWGPTASSELVAESNPQTTARLGTNVWRNTFVSDRGPSRSASARGTSPERISPKDQLAGHKLDGEKVQTWLEPLLRTYIPFATTLPVCRGPQGEFWLRDSRLQSSDLRFPIRYSIVTLLLG